MGRLSLYVLLGLTLLAVSLNDVHVKAEVGPTESECRPYIEKAIHELKTSDSDGDDDGDDSGQLDSGQTKGDSKEKNDDDDDDDDDDDGVAGANNSTETDTKENDDNSEEKNDNDTASSENTEEEDDTKTVEETAEKDDDDDDNSKENDQKDDDDDDDDGEKDGKDSGEKDTVEDSKEDGKDSGENESKIPDDGESDENSKEPNEKDDDDDNDDANDTKENDDPSESGEDNDAKSKEDATNETDDDDDDQHSKEVKTSDTQEDDSKENDTEEDDNKDDSKEDTEEVSETIRKKRSADLEADDNDDDNDSKTDSAEEKKGEEDDDDDNDSNEEGTKSSEDNKSHDDGADDDDDSKEKDGSKVESSEDKKSDGKTDDDDDDDDKDDSKENDDAKAESSEDNKSDGKADDDDDDDSKEKDTAEAESSEDNNTDEDGDSKEDDAKVHSSDAKKSDGDDDDDDDDDSEESHPEDDLLLEEEIPENLRDRKHVSELLHLDEEFDESEHAQDRVAEIILRDIKRIYETAIKPLETLYKYRDLSNRHFGDPEIFSKPLVLFMGPWSGGKSSIINYLTDNEFKANSLRTGAEPSPAYFNILMWGNETEVLDGTQLAADYTFSGLQKFGQGLEERLRGLKMPSKLLEKVNIVEIPGILEVRKQVSRLFPFNDACQWFIDRADIIILVYDPAKLDAGPETEAILDQLKGREYQTRIILNKADTVKPEELLRVQSALIWNISPLMSSAQPPAMYTTSLWSRPYDSNSPVRLLQAQERSFLRDLRSAIEKRIENRIAGARRFAVRVRNHAKMVDCYLNTYYNHKTIFGNKKRISDEIIQNPQNYHIYEGLSTLTNISRYDLPDPEVYRDFFRLNPLYEFKKLSQTCTYFRGCPINKLDVAIAYDLPELGGKYKKMADQALANLDSTHDTKNNKS